MATLPKPHPQKIKEQLCCSANVTPSDIDRIWRIVLEEMMICFWPPGRADTANEFEYQTVIAAGRYLDSLVEFDDSILTAGWKKTVNAHKVMRWPTVAEIREACLSCQRVLKGASGGPENANEGVIERLNRRTAQIMLVARSYSRSFLQGELGQQAKDEGWFESLREYVERESHLQAQRIVRTGSGHVDVLIPSEMIDKWRSA